MVECIKSKSLKTQIIEYIDIYVYIMVIQCIIHVLYSIKYFWTFFNCYQIIYKNYGFCTGRGKIPSHFISQYGLDLKQLPYFRFPIALVTSMGTLSTPVYSSIFF